MLRLSLAQQIETTVIETTHSKRVQLKSMYHTHRFSPLLVLGLAVAVISSAAAQRLQRFPKVENLKALYKSNVIADRVVVSWDKVSGARSYSVRVEDSSNGANVAKKWKVPEGKKVYFKGDLFKGGGSYTVKVRVVGTEDTKASAFASIIYEHPLKSTTACNTQTASSFYQRLQELTNGETELFQSTKNRLLGAHQEDFHAGLLGASFGDTMDEVIAVWGHPTDIWMLGSNDHVTKLYFYAGSSLDFEENALIKISIHSADFPDVELIEGIILDEPAPNLETLFPDGDIVESSNDRIQEIELNTHLIRLHESSENKLMALSVERK